MNLPKLYLEESGDDFIAFELLENKQVLVFNDKVGFRIVLDDLKKMRDWADLVAKMIEYKKQHGD